MQKDFFYRGKPYRFKDISFEYHRVRMKLPPMIGTEAVLFVKNRFSEQNWIDSYTHTWPKRKTDYKKRSRQRNLLVNSGRLRNSIRIIMANPSMIVIGTNVPYASAHNEGFKGTVQVRSYVRGNYSKNKIKYQSKNGRETTRTVRTHSGRVTNVRSHSRKMNLPQRQFIGDSQFLDIRIERLITLQIDKIFK